MEQNSLKAIKALKDKGEIIVVAGHTGCGKSHFLNSFAINDKVKEILKLRTGKGKGSLTETEIYVTNHPEIAEDSLYVTGKFKKVENVFSGDEFCDYINEILIKIFRKYNKAEKTITLEEVLKEYEDYISNLVYSNDNLKSMLQKILMKIEDKEVDGNRYLYIKVEEYLRANEDLIPYLLDEYIEFKKDSKSKNKIDSFVEYLEVKEQEEMPFNKLKKLYSEHVVGLFTEDLEVFKRKIASNGGILYSNEPFDFGIELNENTNKEVKKLILNSEKESKEYFIEDFSLCFRGRAELWNVWDKDLAKIQSTIYQNKAVYLLHFVDTMGLYHKENVKKDDEQQRLVSILEKYRSKILVLIHSSLEDAIVKATKNMETDLLGTLRETVIEEEVEIETRDLNIFSVFTKVDMGVYDNIVSQDCQNEITTVQRLKALRGVVESNYEFVKGTKNLDDNKVYMYGLKGSEDIYDLLQNYRIIEDEDGNSIKDIGAMTVTEQSQRLMKDIREVMTKKILITSEELERLKGLGKDIIDLSALETEFIEQYTENLDECIENFLVHYNTVLAVINRWKNRGTKFTSKGYQKGKQQDVEDNRQRKYDRISTDFVEHLRSIFCPVIEKGIKAFSKETDLLKDNYIDGLQDYWYIHLLELIYEDCKKGVDTTKYYRIWLNGVFKNCKTKYNEDYFSLDVKNEGEKEIEKLINEAYKDAVKELTNRYCIL